MNTEVPMPVITQASNFTVANWGAMHVITGAATATLPAPSSVPAGTWTEFYLTVDEDFAISCTNLLVADNDATATSVTWGQTGEQIGNSARVISDGSAWLVQLHLADEANSQAIA